MKEPNIFRYNGLSHFQQETQVLHLFTDTNRSAQFTITIHPRQVGAIREALNALMLVLEPGFIYRSTTGKGEINYDDRAENKAVSRNRFFTTIRKQIQKQSWEWIQPFPSKLQRDSD